MKGKRKKFIININKEHYTERKQEQTKQFIFV